MMVSFEFEQCDLRYLPNTERIFKKPEFYSWSFIKEIILASMFHPKQLQPYFILPCHRVQF